MAVIGKGGSGGDAERRIEVGHQQLVFAVDGFGVG
jgi:hypothetical protein